jgi:hypothetical protein
MTEPLLFPELAAAQRHSDAIDRIVRTRAATASARIAALVEAVQAFADEQGLAYDDDDREAIDAALLTLSTTLDHGLWGLLPPLPVRCLNWRTRHAFDDLEPQRF